MQALPGNSLVLHVCLEVVRNVAASDASRVAIGTTPGLIREILAVMRKWVASCWRPSPCLTLMRHTCSCDVRRYSYAARMQVACNSALCNLGFAQENRDVINSGSGAVLIRASPLRVPPRDAERVQAYVSHSCLCVAVCGCVCP